MAPPPPPSCGHCQEPEKPGVHLLQCTGCHEASYCCPAHQAADWKSHKILCKQRKKDKEKEKENGQERKAESNATVTNFLYFNPTAAVTECSKDLCQACFDGEHEKARRILQQGRINVNWSYEGKGLTAVHVASQEGKALCLAVLIEYHFNVNAITIKGHTPAYYASQNGHTACVSLLAKHGADLMTLDNKGDSPIHSACFNGHYDVVKVLLEDGKVDPNTIKVDPINQTMGQTLAMVCCQNGHMKLLHLLIQHNVDLNRGNEMGWTPAHTATIFGYTIIVLII